MNKILLGSAIAFFLTLAAHAADAPAIWGDQCAKCHGDDGKGDTKMGHKLSIKDLTDAAVQAAFTDDEGFKAIKDGITDKNGKSRMKPIEGLSDDEMKAMVKYVRGLKK
jgi:mono/diheme cytochrome c family protein